MRGDSVRAYRPIRTARTPLPAQALLVAGVLCLAFLMFFVGTGFATRMAAGIGGALGDLVSRAVPQTSATPAPSVTPLDAPLIDAPANDGYTNTSPVTITGTIPRELVSKTGYSVRILAVTATDTRLTVGEVATGGTVRFSVSNVPLVAGVNKFVAQLVGPQGALDESPPVTYTLDTTPPTIAISSPANNALIKGSTANITGKTEAGATVTARNTRTTSVGANAVADADGKFQVSVGLSAGSNAIVVTAADQAGNQKTAQLTLRRSLGQLAAHLTVSPARVPIATATKVTLTVRLTASDGSPLSGGQAVFTLNIKGLGPITSPTIKTNGSGVAVFTTTISGATAGSGTAAVLVTTPTGDTVSDRATILTVAGP